MSLLTDFSLSQFQIYAAVFIMGSFSVATLSDLKHMSAQSEFLEVWLIIVLAIGAYDGYRILKLDADYTPIALKWGIIFLFSMLSHEYVGVYAKVATGDMLACIAAASVLTAGMALLFFIVLKIIDLITRPFISPLFGSGSAYPFMSAVFVSSGITLGISVWMSGGIGI